jgi:DNA-binding winged helix-turn-helix (wHTH) protein/tetratricopeptide (TPR) repeat protein
LDGRVDPARRVAQRGGEEVRLTAREAELVLFLLSRAGQTIPRERLLSEVFGYQPAARTRTLDTTIRRLRSKLEPDPARPQLLQTVHGTGYRWVAPQRAPQPPAPSVLIGPRAHVPLDPMPLVGRERELQSVLQGLAQGPVALCGPGGVGKSRLAREAAHRWSVATGAPAWWVSADGLSDPGELVARVARAMALRVSGLERLAERLVRMGPLLLVLDGVDLLPLAALATLLPGVLLTARARPELAVPVVRLGPLEEEAARTLFLSCARTRLPAFEPDEGELSAVLHAVDRLPLAVQLAAARVRVLDLRQLRSRLDRGIDVLAELADPSEHGALGRVLQRSWELLPAQGRRAAVAAAVPEGPFDLETARVVLGEGADEALEVLVDASWLETSSEGFLVLAPIRSWLREREPPVTRAALAALARARARQAAELDPLFGPVTPEAGAWLSRVAPDLPRLLSLLARAEGEARPLWLAAGFWALAVGDEAGAARVWEEVGGELGALHRSRSTALPAAERLALLDQPEASDARWRAAAELERERIHISLGQADPERLGALLSQTDDPLIGAEACRLLAQVHAARGHWDLAGEARKRGLRLVAGRRWLLELELLIAPFPLPQADEPPIEVIQAALATARLSSDRRLVVRMATVLAMTALGHARLAEAETAALEAVDAVMGLSSPTLRAGVFGNTGIVLRELRRFDVAESLFARVLDEVPQAPHYHVSAAVNLAWCALDQGQLLRAEQHLDRAGPVTEETEIATVELLRGICEALGGGSGVARWRAAIERLRRACAPTHLARTLLVLSTADPPDADELLTEAWTLAVRYDEAATCVAIDDQWTRRGHPPRLTAPQDRPDPGLWLGLVRLTRRLSHPFTSRR